MHLDHFQNYQIGILVLVTKKYPMENIKSQYYESNPTGWFLTLSTRVQRIYFLFNFYLGHTIFSLFFNSKKNYFLTFFDTRPPSFAKLMFCKFKISKKAVGTKIGNFCQNIFWGLIVCLFKRKGKVSFTSRMIQNRLLICS